MNSFFPKICPACGEPLIIEVGDKSETLKLMCKNKSCAGSLLKRLQKGIIALEIRGLGPKVIENLMNAGINSSLDLFDPEVFNEKSLISSGYFQKGRSLEKIFDSVKNTKSIPIHKFILSLQIDDVGKTVSEKLGQLISGLTPDFSGLPYTVRDNIDTLVTEIKNGISIVENAGVEIVRNEPPKKVVATKTVTKRVAADSMDTEIFMFIAKLGWEIASIDNDCDMLVVQDKNVDSPEIRKAKEIGLKIMTLKQIKLLFG
jgi:NAD-dependent DNA ligase